jgi:UPF0755 protein
VSRRSRRRTQGEQDWDQGAYPGDGDDPGEYLSSPGDYPPEQDWGPDPLQRPRREDFPAAGEPYPGHPGPGRQPADAYGWAPGPPEGRAAQPWERSSWEAEPWGSEPWEQQPWEEQSWEQPGGFPGGPGGGLAPLPPSLPGPEHPSGPLPPLPEPDWADPGGRPSGPPRSGYPLGPAGFAAEPPQPHGRQHYAPDPRADAGPSYPGYEQYVDDPRELDTSSYPEPGDYSSAGDWYEDVDEPGAWAEEGHRSDLLPGLNQGSGGRGAGKPAGGPSTRKRRRRSRVAIIASLMVFVLILGAGGAVGYHYYRAYFAPPDFSGPGSGSVLVQIQPGEVAAAVGQRLAALGVVASARAFYNAAKANPRGNTLEPGTYRVHKHMKASLALALLLNPSSRVQVKVTIPEGFRLSQIITLLGQKTGNLKGYQQAIAHPAALGLPAFANGKPEGYLFPATYNIQPKQSPVSVLRNMVQQFDQQAASINLKGAAMRGHESPGAVITVASLIEAEGKRAQDYPRIAEVIYNRLNATPPIKLQLDTTVLYAMNLAHSKAKFSTNFPSPYNTYLHGNLPPGPIDNPGRAAIEAALHPAHGSFLYFLTINSATGQTLFFSNAQQFNAAVAKYGSTGTGTGTHARSG